MKMKEKKIFLKICLFSIIIIFSCIFGLNNANNQNIDNIINSKPLININENEEEKQSNEKLEIHFIDVNQGDSILIKCNNESMLIDAGENDYGDVVLKYLQNQNISKLKYIVGTHGDSDHIGGLDVIINNINFDEIYFPKQIKTTNTYIDFVNSIKNKNKQITIPRINNQFTLGDAKITILSPEEKEYENSNNYSIVLKLDYYNNSFIFMGDAEKEIENYLINNNSNIKADLIKIGHHGSNSSTTSNFIKKVDPKYAVITVGVNNEYNHPSQKVVDRLNKMNINIYRTDIDGSIIIRSDGNNINIEKKGK